MTVFSPDTFDFYAETDGDGRDLGIVAAIHRNSSRRALRITGCFEGLAGITLRDDSAPSGPSVSWLSIAPGYLDARCRAVSEAEARRIHPALFAHLDRHSAGPEDEPTGEAVLAIHELPRGEA